MNSQPARTPRLRRALTVSLLLLAMAPAGAAAQTPSDDGYENDGPTVQNQIEGGSAGQSESGSDPQASTPADERSEEAGLPFTGLDLALVAGAGAVLVGLGAGMRVALRLPPGVR